MSADNGVYVFLAKDGKYYVGEYFASVDYLSSQLIAKAKAAYDTREKALDYAHRLHGDGRDYEYGVSYWDGTLIVDEREMI